MARRITFAALVVALALTLVPGHALPPTPSGYLLKGTISASGRPATFHAVGSICFPLCNAAGYKGTFDFTGQMMTKGALGNNCLGLGHGAMTVAWATGAGSLAYFDIIPLTPRVIEGTGSVLSGWKAGAKAAMTIYSTTRDPCVAPVPFNGVVALR